MTSRPDAASGVSGRPRLRSLLGSLLVSSAMVVAYFVLPLTAAFDAGTVLVLFGGICVVAVLLAWQVVSIIRSPYPLARAIGALTITVPMFLLVFALSYFVMGRVDASHWSEPLNRMDALYFSVTVFATVGFGDIAATSDASRAVVTVQMIGDLVLVGLVARVIVQAVQGRFSEHARQSPPRLGPPS